MTVKEYMNLPIIDENERVLVVTSDSNHRQLFKGLLCAVPAELLEENLWIASALSAPYIEKYRLDRRLGWTGLFLEMEDN